MKADFFCARKKKMKKIVAKTKKCVPLWCKRVLSDCQSTEDNREYGVNP